MSHKIHEFHTGLFLDQKKCGVLLEIVQDLLRNRYRLVAFGGPQQPNNSCEVLLRPLNFHQPGVNFHEAQVLLAKYLSMIKESQPKMFAGEEPELIDLDASDDEPMDEASVIIVDLNESNIFSKRRNSEEKISPIVNLTNSDIVDSVSKEFSILKSSNAGKSDPKDPKFNEEKNSIIVNIVDSDVVVVDSVKKHKSSSKSSSSNAGKSDPKEPQFNDKKNSMTVNVIDSDIVAVDSDIVAVDSDIVAVDSDIIAVDSVMKQKSSSKSSSSNINSVDISKLLSPDSKDRNTDIVNFVDSDVIFVDSVTKQNVSPKSSPLNIDSSNVLEDSNKQSKKRKKNSGNENARNIEIVEILDDEIIELDDSLTTCNPSWAHSSLSASEVTVVSNSVPIGDSLPQSVNQLNSVCTTSRNNNGARSSSSSTSTHLPHPDTTQKTIITKNVSKKVESECEVGSLSLGPPKKKSKLAYHRPAHLVTPLTEPTSDVPSTKVDSVSNIYNPNAHTSEKRTGLRPIVIDGNNVAIGHGKGTFSLRGIQICINFFEKRGHRQIKVFIPQYRKNRDTHDELHKMERKGLVVTTPSRRVNGKIVASYDDRYIVQYAAEFGGVIVSTDNFRDLLSENPSWKDTIENRLLMFSWADDLLMFPQDPLGRKGPSLDDFLKFPDT